MRWSALLACVAALAACAATSNNENVRAVMDRFPLRATQAELVTAIEQYCARSQVIHYTAAEAAPYARQEQVDCHGYVFAGAPRKLELLINEGALGFYWLMIEPGEIEATRQSLVAAFGAPTCETDNYTIFDDANVALRREPAEILVALPADFQAITGGC